MYTCIYICITPQVPHHRSLFVFLLITHKHSLSLSDSSSSYVRLACSLTLSVTHTLSLSSFALSSFAHTLSPFFRKKDSATQRRQSVLRWENKRSCYRQDPTKWVHTKIYISTATRTHFCTRTTTRHLCQQLVQACQQLGSMSAASSFFRLS
jgi:hypothetical protein